MNCPDDAHLSLYLDGEGGLVGSAERRLLESHLEGCTRCRGVVDDLRALSLEAARFARDVEPARDLWPAIRPQVAVKPEPAASSQPFGPSWRLAAGIAFFLLSASVVALLLRTTGTPAPQEETVAMLEEISSAEAEFEAAATHLLTAIESRRADLTPETLSLVERNVKLLDSAIAQTRRALFDQTASIELARLLTGIHHKKIDLLRTAVLLPSSA